MGIYGQDWASYQSPTPDTAGLSFAFVKVTEGLTYINPKWTAQRDHAKANGLVWGAYHYPHMHNPDRAEADFFLKQNSWQPGDLIVLDWEGYDQANASVSAADQLAYKEDYLQYVKSRLPHNPVGLYCNADYWNRVDTTRHCGDFLWIATSGKPASQPGIMANWLFHQYSDQPLDSDYCRLGSTAELRAWALAFQPAPQPVPAPQPAIPQPQPQQGDDMFGGDIPAAFAFDAAGNLTARKNVKDITIPIIADNRWNWSMVDVTFTCDFTDAGDQPALLRVAVHNSTSGWRVETVEVQSAAGPAHVWIQAGDDKVSVGRMMTSSTDASDDIPISWLVQSR